MKFEPIRLNFVPKRGETGRNPPEGQDVQIKVMQKPVLLDNSSVSTIFSQSPPKGRRVYYSHRLSEVWYEARS